MIPLGDDNPRRRVPVATIALIAVNVAVFLAVSADLEQVVLRWGYDAARPLSVEVLTSMFLHGGFGHLLGNMWFLWIFGDNVEDKLGSLPFTLVYLVCGAVATWAYTALALVTEHSPELMELLHEMGREHPPLVGASGAIFGIMGIYMVFFPEARIRMLWFLMVLPVQAKWFIGYKILLDVFVTAQSRSAAAGGVATAAHVGGAGFGILAGFALKRLVGGGGRGDTWDVHTGFAKAPHFPPKREPWFGNPLPREVRTPDWEDGQLHRLEEELVDLVRTGNPRAAIDLYPMYERMAREKPLPGDVQIEIAHELYRQGLPRDALAAYRRYLETEPQGEDAPEARFRVGVLLSRALGRPDAAAPWLRDAARTHPDPRTAAFAEAELRRVGG